MTTSLQRAGWLHYHGHCDYSAGKTHEQSLVLAKEHSTTEIHGDPIESDLSDCLKREDCKEETVAEDLETDLFQHCSKLTIANVFAMNLSQSNPVICMIACDSGVQEVSSGDEPFGMISALFCAGASSVVGTLWPIESFVGREFSSKFYEHIQNQLCAAKGKVTARFVLDLTAAFREATLHLKTIKSEPLAWAAFTLNGAGFA